MLGTRTSREALPDCEARRQRTRLHLQELPFLALTWLLGALSAHSATRFTPRMPGSLPLGVDNDTLTLDALHDVFDVSMQVLCDLIDIVHPTDASRESRALIATMLEKLPILCTSMRDKIRNDGRFTAVMFYERTRMGAMRSGHFLEGLGAGLPLFSGCTTMVVPDALARRLEFPKDFVLGLTETERSDPRDALAVSDLHPGVPRRVCHFVSRCRALCQGLRRVKPATAFVQCRNCECARCFYASTSVNASHSVPAATASSNNYWDMAAGAPEVQLRQAEFCTRSCYMQWKSQLQSALPDTSEGELVSDYGCRSLGRARVAEAFRLCSKRNERAARHLRRVKMERRLFPALGSTELQNQLTRRVRMLNVDLGLLYAASVLAESSTVSKNKALAGGSEGWRSRPLFYAKAIKEVLRMYNKHHVGGNVIANMFVDDPFLNRFKERALRIF